MEWKKPILKKINKYYGASFECSDFESLYKLVDEALTSAYERGLNDGKKNKQVDKEFQAMLLTGLPLKDLVVEEK